MRKITKSEVLIISIASECNRVKGERTHRALEVDDLAGQFVDSAGDPGVSPKHLRLDLVDVIGEAHHDGGVPIDQRIEDRV